MSEPVEHTAAENLTEEVPHEGGSGIHISLKAEELFRVGGWPVTNSTLLAMIVLVLLGGLAFAARNRLRMIPGKLQSLFELFLEALLGLMDTVFGDRRRSEQYLPLVATIFLFVLFSNWFGLLPGVGSLIFEGHERAPLFRAPSADLNFTLGLAVVSVVASNLFGIAAIGFWKHLGKFFNFRGREHLRGRSAFDHRGIPGPLRRAAALPVPGGLRRLRAGADLLHAHHRFYRHRDRKPRRGSSCLNFRRTAGPAGAKISSL
ncbi:MAG: ATP synthase subunit a [Parcubacteria group bacterium GW2011_GWA1_59_11]|nr:MAG: ATP synthase subunit a [Parcubacteria group bacterium GW2011_GWA1_59_11]